MHIDSATQKTDLLSYYLLVLALLLFPINFSIASFRPTDFILLLLIFIQFPRLRFYLHQAIVPCVFGVALVFSTAIGLASVDELKATKIVFFYKYFLAFLLLPIFLSIRLSERHVKRVKRVLYFVFLVLIAWIFYQFLTTAKGNWRPSFPFSSGKASDAHLYSMILAIGGVATWLSDDFKKWNFICKVLFIGTVMAALFITGSRTGIVLVAVGVLSSFVLEAKKVRYDFLLLGLLIVVFFGMALLLFEQFNVSEKIGRLFRRATTFNLANDVSSQYRLLKLSIAVNESHQTGFLFGMGPLSSRAIWYDSAVANLLAMTGVTGLLSVIAYAGVFLAKVARLSGSIYQPQRVKILFVVFGMYLVANLITEFFLVTRGLFPFLILCFLLLKEGEFVLLGQPLKPRN